MLTQCHPAASAGETHSLCRQCDGGVWQMSRNKMRHICHRKKEKKKFESLSGKQHAAKGLKHVRTFLTEYIIL